MMKILKNFIYTINWDKITRPKALGGVGLRIMSLLNACYVAKMKWNYFYNPNRPTASLLAAKYGYDLKQRLYKRSF